MAYKLLKLSFVVKALSVVALTVPVTVALPAGPSAGANGAVAAIDDSTANRPLTARGNEVRVSPSKLQA
ncbi:hypothetical protein PpBr36_02205 [Pyricularia pennisetigena]|uniref:hypothetical protein n=1 Tax=Pyricularia pennisetigena TaxID=1578925 RepID=UPI00115249E8|nr:hypothetical protein PpBr36_02205 [Pyricularia pennisetigena]TLS29911.1 hypothetical protein PpBr36_02205 [Pyricularia pennisetigena]